MPVELWLAYTVACATLLAIPGPTVMLVVSYALGHGRSAGWATIPGVALGHYAAMTVSLLGAGAMLAASVELFTALKLAIGAYLIWQGVGLLRRPRPKIEVPGDTGPGDRNGSIFRNAFVVTALNPKSVVFFAAFVPQFIVAEQPPLPQFVVLQATFLILAAANTALWACLAGEMHARFRHRASLRLASGIGGAVLIGAGLLIAIAPRG